MRTLESQDDLASLGRLFGLSFSRLSDEKLAEAIRLCSAYLLVDLPCNKLLSQPGLS